MKDKKRIPVRAQITYEIKEYTEDPSNFYPESYSEEGYKDNLNEAETFDVQFDLPKAEDEFIEALERWTDVMPDEISHDEIEDGFGMLQFDDMTDEFEETAEFGGRQSDLNQPVSTSVPQKIVIFFSDGSEEEITITDQEDTLERVLRVIGNF